MLKYTITAWHADKIITQIIITQKKKKYKSCLKCFSLWKKCNALVGIVSRKVINKYE